MDYGHPLRFGTLVTATALSPGDAVEQARLAEKLGFDLVGVPDHPDRPDLVDAWTLLSWLAARTGTIHLAAGPLDLTARPAAVVARAAASLDLLSAGRLELALDAAGPAGGHGIAAAGEAIDVIRGIWAAGDRSPLHVDGRHHRVAGAERGPAPAHNVPIWIGGHEPGVPPLAGRAADGWLATPGALEPGRPADCQKFVDEAAVEAGRDPREIRRLATITGRFTGTSGGFLARQWADELLTLVMEAGFSTFILDSGDPDTLRRFAAEVVPALREAVAAERAARGVTETTVPSLRVRERRRDGIDYDQVPASLAAGAVEPGDAEYARVRSTYLRGGSPGLVLRPRTVAEVAEAVGFARTQPVPLSLRSGGHGVSGRSTNHGGIVIDVSALNSIEVVDEPGRRVRIGPGARWSDVAAALAPHGWALSSGDYGGVGVGGLTVAGGIGWLVREHGLTLDHLRAVDLVLADGSTAHADETENAELFWGVRGAGANFGIVTSFEFEVDEVTDVGFARLFLDASDIAGFLQRWGATMEAAPRDVTASLIIGRPRPGQPVVAQVMAVVDAADAETVVDRLQPFAAVAPLLDYSITIQPYAEIMHVPPGWHDGQGEPVTRSALADHLTPELAEAAAGLIASGETYFFQIRAVGGAVSDVPPGATAYAGRSANFQLVAFAAGRRRLDSLWDGMRRHFSGLYLNFETDLRPERLDDAFPPATLRRLRELKRRYDPGNVFRDNFNIAP